MNFRVTTQEFCMVGGYTEDLINHTTVKIGGWALAWGWVLARDNTVHVHVCTSHFSERYFSHDSTFSDKKETTFHRVERLLSVPFCGKSAPMSKLLPNNQHCAQYLVLHINEAIPCHSNTNNYTTYTPDYTLTVMI